jgi:adenylate cyclase
LDLIRVKGKSKPTKVYELIGFKNDESAVKKLSELKIYFEALELYRQRNFEDAKKIFLKSFELFKDEPSKIYAERCEHFISNPPKENWDGVFEMKSK